MEHTIARKNHFGITGLAAAMIAFALAVLPPWLSQINQPPPRPIEDVIADTAVKIKDRMIAHLEIRTSDATGTAVEARTDWGRYANVGSMVLAVAAILLAVLSFVRREDKRICAGAVALGGAALAWQFLMMALAVIFVAIIICGVLSFLGVG